MITELVLVRDAGLAPIEEISRTWPGEGSARPQILIAHSDRLYLGHASRHFRRLGWEVRRASSGAAARQLAFAKRPSVVALETNLPDESGWLSCCKLRHDGVDAKVILIEHAAEEWRFEFARFVGACGVVLESDGIAALVDAVYDGDLARVG